MEMPNGCLCNKTLHSNETCRFGEGCLLKWPRKPQLCCIMNFFIWLYNCTGYSTSLISFYIILPSMLRSRKWVFPSDIPTKTVYAFQTHDCCTSHPSPPPAFDHPNNIWWTVGLKIIKLLKWNFIKPPVTFRCLGLNADNRRPHR
jgi:hypothetical protein